MCVRDEMAQKGCTPIKCCFVPESVPAVTNNDERVCSDDVNTSKKTAVGAEVDNA